MITELSADTQAILLLTAPLIVGRRTPAARVLQPGEYIRLARFLHENGRQPADLLSPDASDLLHDDQQPIDADRLTRLLARDLLLGLAVEHWRSRAIWVLSRADDGYPTRLKERLGTHAPPILYGCGDDPEILESGGLAVVGSRHADGDRLDYAARTGELAARAGITLVSGGARGIDQAAMRGAVEAEGRVAGVLSNDLQRMALQREHRDLLVDGRLLLISPYDPSAGFNVGNAMQRNKLIYALADAALIVSTDYQKGGTWAGAVEQVDKLGLVPVYVRSDSDQGLAALRRKGAERWPCPETPEELNEVLARAPRWPAAETGQAVLPFGDGAEPENPDERLLAAVAAVLIELTASSPKSLAELKEDLGVLGVSGGQARMWLKRLVDDGRLEKERTPVRYKPVARARLAVTTALASPGKKFQEEIVRLLIELTASSPKSLAELKEDLGVLGVSGGQARMWLSQLVKDGVLEKLTGPVRYRPASQPRLLAEPG